MKPVSEHVREHRSALAGLEKRILMWLAVRLPRWATPDHLTLLGLGAMLAAGLMASLPVISPAARPRACACPSARLRSNDIACGRRRDKHA